MFKTIQSIEVNDASTWRGFYFLTIDIDWAHDEVLRDTIDLVEKADVAATWFVTHDTPLLARLRENKKFELGIHPNFNFLFEGRDDQGKTAEEVVDRILEIVPEAKSVRSHSMTQSTNILDLFKRKGLVFDCNHFVPWQSGIELKPWRLWNDLVKVPYSWEDDVACMYSDLDDYSVMKRQKGLRVLDFHPIHVFLNTEDMARYERTRDVQRSPGDLMQHRNSEVLGVRDVLCSVLRWD